MKSRNSAGDGHIRLSGRSRSADILRSLALTAPPNFVLGDIAQSLRGLGEFAAIGKRLWQNDSPGGCAFLACAIRGDMLDAWFGSDPLKAVLGFDAVVGNLASPYSAGLLGVLLHHVFGEVNGRRAWGTLLAAWRDHAAQVVDPPVKRRPCRCRLRGARSSHRG